MLAQGRKELVCGGSFRIVEEYVATGLKWISWAIGIATAFGFILKFFEWGNKGPFLYLKNNLQSIWMWAMTAVALLLVNLDIPSKATLQWWL